MIIFPAYPVQLPTGWVEFGGLAWRGRGKITKVEVSTDAGKNWRPAQLQAPVLDKAHTVFRYLWYWNGIETEILSPATDNTDYLQPTLGQLIAVRRADMGGYHLNPTRAPKGKHTAWAYSHVPNGFAADSVGHFPGISDDDLYRPARQGKVAKIHTGFNGPATGHYYEEFKKEFKAEVDLLARRRFE